jgi:hypothetical protein
MPHTVADHENFASLLDRLTQRMPATEPIVKMVPIEKLKAKTDRPVDEVSELSYEKALRIHRRDVSEIGAPASAPKLPASELACSQGPSAQASTLATKVPPPRIGQQKRAAKQTIPAKPARSVQHNTSKHHTEGVVKTKSKAGSEAGSKSSIHGSKAVQAGESQGAATRARRQQPARRIQERQSEKPRPRPELGLEIAAKAPPPEHRHAVVSLRLSDAEFDRLRLRAAESGISVSAYMRSCVLDAEHLRTQVKEALSQMRASMRDSLEHATEQSPAQLAPPLPVRSRTQSHSGLGGAWSRLLQRSATFFLGPSFPFRHRA